MELTSPKLVLHSEINVIDNQRDIMSILCKISNSKDNPLNFLPRALAHFQLNNKARVKGRHFKQLISHQFIVNATSKSGISSTKTIFAAPKPTKVLFVESLSANTYGKKNSTACSLEFSRFTCSKKNCGVKDSYYLLRLKGV